MLKVALTGGIGSGKSTVTQLFADFGIPIIDADVIAHQLCQPGQYAVKQIASHFGHEFITDDGELNRAKLRALVFSEPDKKKQLENLLHPLIYTQIETEMAQLTSAYCIVCIPLLVETEKKHLVDRVLVVDCSEDMQIERVKTRSQLPISQINAIIASQASRAERLAIADDIIDNSKLPSHLAEQVKKLHNLYLLLSSA